MENLPSDVIEHVNEFLAPALTVAVYAAVWLIGQLGLVARKTLPKVAALTGFAIGVAFALSPFTSVLNLASQALAGGVIGLAASGLREATRKKA